MLRRHKKRATEGPLVIQIDLSYLLEFGEQVSETLVTWLTVSVAAVPVAEAGLVVELAVVLPVLGLALALEVDGLEPAELELDVTGMPRTETSLPT